MLKKLKIADIEIGKRHRKDMGDLTALADSIRRLGLLQPIGVTEDLNLVFGERRLRATRDILKKKTITAHIVDVESIVSGEYAENEIRKDFTTSERVAIAKAIEKKIGNRQGQRTDKTLRENIPEVAHGRRTREIAAEKAGFGNDKTFRQAAKVVKNGTPQLIQAMDDGRVSISAASILTDVDHDEQDEIVELDAKAILEAAKEIRARQAEQRAKHQAATTIKPRSRNKKQRLKATRLIHGDSVTEMKKLRANSIDLILTDPPYPEIDREYGKLTEPEWHDLMHAVVTEGRRVLKPTGSMVVILQPNFEKIGKMRVWLWEFMAWAGREWNIVQDAYWWNHGCLPSRSSNRQYGLMRQSMKMCVWLGPPDCYRNQDSVLWLPSDDNFAQSKSDSALRIAPSGQHYRGSRIANTVAERWRFNTVQPSAGGRWWWGSGEQLASGLNSLRLLSAWWVKYLLPEKGVLLDCFAGSGTMLMAGLDYGASRVIGIDKQKKYLKVAEKRLCE